MEISSAKWMSELGMDDSTFFHQDQMNLLDYPLDGLNFQPFSSQSYYPQSTQNTGGSYIGASNRASVLSSSSTTERIIPCSSKNISFNNLISSPTISQQVRGINHAMNPRNEAAAGSYGNINLSSFISLGSQEDRFCLPEFAPQSRKVGSVPRTPLHAEEHLIAERKRREKLSQRLIALSALVPGLKKTDKASVLGDTIKYLKQLQERVKTLEEEAAKKTMESMIIVKKSHICLDDETSSSNEKFCSQSNQYLPEIDARVSDRDVLIRILCEKKEECIVKLLKEIEKNHLTVVKSNILPFGKSTLDITVVAQMDVEFAMTLKDLVKNIRLALLPSMSM